MNRRSFLGKTIGAVTALALGSSILPKVIEAKEIEPAPIKLRGYSGGIAISEDAAGGYLFPIEYHDEVRRDMAEALARSIDKEMLK